MPPNSMETAQNMAEAYWHYQADHFLPTARSVTRASLAKGIAVAMVQTKDLLLVRMIVI